MRLAILLFSSILDAFSFNYFLGKFLERKDKSIWFKAITNLIFLMLLSLVTVYLLDAPYALFISFFIVNVFGLVLFKDKIIRVILFVTLIFTISLVSETVVGIALTYLYHTQASVTRSDDALFAQGVILSKAALVLIMVLIKPPRLRDKGRIDFFSAFLLMAVPFSSFSTVYFIAATTYKVDSAVITWVMFVTTIIIIFSNVATFYLLERQANLQQSKNMLDKITEQYNFQSAYYKELKEEMLYTNKNTHDIKNSISVIYMCLSKNDVERAKAKMTELTGMMPAINAVNTGNDAVNALLKFKMKKISEEIPDNRISICIPKGFEMDEMDLCVLIGNAIDNAIEACLKLEDIEKRYFEIQIFPFNEQLSMRFENSTIVNKPKRDLFTTSKPKAFMHGFGIESMRSICEKYNGSIVFEQLENKFVVSVMI